MKSYDQSYYNRWYRSRAVVVTPASRRRKVRLALAAAEFMLGREIRSVLDVGCGEALWRAELLRARPGIRYLGLDSSDYVVRRYGAQRNIRKGNFATVGRLGLKRPFDLIVCADVIAYVPTPELLRGLVAVRKLMRGVAYIEAYTTGDEVVGDLEGWHLRSAAQYRKAFDTAGLVACGLHCYISRSQLHLAGELERCG